MAWAYKVSQVAALKMPSFLQRNQQMLLIQVNNEHQGNCSFCQVVCVETEKLIVFMP